MTEPAAPHPAWGGRATNDERLRFLQETRALRLPHGPGGVFVSPELDPEAFGRDVSIRRAALSGSVHVGDGAELHDVRASGRCHIGAGASLGFGGPLALKDAFVGVGARVCSGFIESSAILARAQLGYASSIRPRCIIDRGASLGQSNDLKNTVLGAHSLLGSSTNFCDIAALGGRPGPPVGQTEIGSGVIHFNFGVHGKKWGSWIGSIGALFLDRPRCFIGGNTSIIGPALIPDGSITVVGAQVRGELPEGPGAQRLIYAAAPPPFVKAFDPSVYSRLGEKVLRTRIIIGRYRALRAFFEVARPRLGEDPAAIAAVLPLLDAVIAERVQWLRAIAEDLPASIAALEKRSDDVAERIAEQRALLELEDSGRLAALAEVRRGDEILALEIGFCEALETHDDEGTVTERLLSLPERTRDLGRAWLRAIVAESC